MKNKLYFSLVSGEVYSVPEDEFSKQGNDKIPLSEKPDSNCKKCFGRMYLGRHLRYSTDGWVFDHYVPCPRCLRKCLDISSVTSDTGRVEILEPSDNVELTDDNEVLQTPTTK